MALLDAPTAHDHHPIAAPPHSLAAEESVLGAILLTDATLYGLVIHEGLKPEDFYRRRHAVIYEGMLELYGASEPVDALTVTEHLERMGRLEDAGGAAYIDGLAMATPNAANARHYAEIVKERALLRRVLTATQEIQTSIYDHEGEARDLVER